MKLQRFLPLIVSLLLICAMLTGCVSAYTPIPPTSDAGTVELDVSDDVENTSDIQDTVDSDDTQDEGDTPAPSMGINGSPVKLRATDAAPLIAPENGEENPSANAVANAANDFAFRLSAAMAEQAGEENLVASPFSVWLPLAALINATDDAHKAPLLEALGAVGITEADVNQAASRMLYSLTRQSDIKWIGDGAHNPLKIANALFVGDDVTLNHDFAQKFMDYYRGQVMNVDFDSQDAVDAVNQWASDNTDGLIESIVDRFDPDTVTSIANAIYFSDRWSQEFNPEMTVEDVFHAPSGNTNTFYMLREGDGQVYYEDDRLQAMPLRFKTGGGMYILLPKDGNAAGLLGSLTNEYFEDIQKNSIRSTGTLLMPRFCINGDATPLKDTLETLGIPLFDMQSAPLTGGLLEDDIPVWLSSAVHKAVIEVDEKGTTAAAVTVLAASTTSIPQPTVPFEMRCDKPFVFVLYGNTYDGGDQVLFTGMVNQP